MNDLQTVKHLYARAGFGLRFADMEAIGRLSVRRAVKKLFEESAPAEPLTLVTGDTDYMMLAKADAETKKMALQKQRQQEKDLNVGWIQRMGTTDAQLRERMTLFWHNHFACRTQNALYAQQLNNIQRENAIGNFRTLLLQVSRSPAMLQFLNNQQNRKNHPNENFARELMELFTIGRGNYTETDVKESARAFTGWGFDKDGQFQERPLLHDTGSKTFLGKTGPLTGEDVIDQLLAQKQTARFISTKLYKFLVNELPDTAHIEEMADVFYNSGYEIKPLLEHVFTSNWFYDARNIGNVIKSPVELLVGLNRQFYITYQKPEVLLQFERLLGQVLFNPPNVAGWPGGKNWIDSSSLMYRLQIPSTVLNGGVIDFHGKADPEDEAYIATLHKQQPMVNERVQTQVDWDKFLGSIPKNLSKAQIAAFLLQTKPDPKIATDAERADDIKTLAIEIASTPEYQLC